MSSPTSPPAGRYGGSSLSPQWAWSIGALLIVSFFVWTAWVMSTDRTTGIEWVAFESTGDGTSAMMKFQITAPPGTPVTCALRTVDDSMGTNGWDIRSYPASQSLTTQHVATLRGVRDISGIEVYRCWKANR